MTLLQKKKLIVPSFVLALLVLLLIGFGVYRQCRENVGAAQRVRHTYEVLGELNATHTLMQDVETGARDYVNSGQDAYLEPFNNATEKIGAKIQSLRGLTADNPEQQRRLDALELLIARRMKMMERNIALRKSPGRSSAEQAMSTDEGQRAMDEIRRVVAEMVAAENHLLERRTEELGASNARTLAFFMVLVVLLAGLLIAALFSVRRNAAAQQRELELAEKARANAENIVDIVREPLLVLDAKLLVQLANRSYYQAFRVTPQETEGKPLYALGSGQWDIPELRRFLGEIVPQHTSFQDFEVEQNFPGIGRRTMILNARKLLRVGNNTETILLAIEDITERKKAKEERDLVFTLSRDMICVAGFDGYFKRLNPAWEKLLGFAAQELMAAPFLEFVHPEDQEVTAAEAARLVSGHEAISFENRYLCKDGTYKWLLWNATPCVARQSIYAVAHDITDRKQAEVALRTSHVELQNRFEAAVRASGQLLYEWNPKTNAVSYGNMETLGFAQETMGAGLTHWVELVHPDDRDRFNAEIDRSLRTKSPFHLEYRISRKDGSYLEVEDRGYFVLGEDGDVGRMVGFVADVSERKQIEEQFRQVQKMEAVGRLAGGIAHDFNNLLGVIIGFSDLLRDRIKGDEGALKYVAGIRKAGDSSAKLMHQLLAFSRKQVLEPRVLDLNGIISDQGKMLHRLIGEDIKLVTVAAPDLGKVKADPGQIEQVILNLVVNARDAMPKGGKLTIETANAVLDERYASGHVAVKPGRYVMMAVSDTGMGMDAETRRRIFEPFFTTKNQGTGLGLATIYGIVKQSDGNIWVYSEPGKGTTFKVYLPRVDAKTEVTGIPVSQEAAKGGSETILLVEDSESLRAVAREYLELAGYTVLEALDGSDAVRMAEQRQTPIDMLLTDVVMPGMSGRDVAEQVKRYHTETKVLYMSGYTDDAIVHHGVLEEGAALLSKPFALESLIRKVRQVLDA